MLVQLSIVFIFVLAMAEPCLRPPQRLAVIIDCTESMSDALGVNGESNTRSEVRQKLEEMVKNLGYHDRIALIAAESPAKILCRTTSEKEKILEALDNYIKKPNLTQNSQAMEQAVDIGKALVARKAGEQLNPRTQNIVLISDGCFPEFDNTVTMPGVHWLPVGKSRDNFALIRTGVRVNPQTGTESILVSVKNYSNQSQSGTLTIGGQNTQITAPANNSENRIISIQPELASENGKIAVSWKPSVGTGRVLELPVLKIPQYTVYLISRGNTILEEALKKIPVVTEVKSVKKIPDPVPENAILVFDGASPNPLPEARCLCFGSKKANQIWDVSDQPVDSVVNSINLVSTPVLWDNADIIGVRFQAPAAIVPQGKNQVLASDGNNQPLAWAIDGTQANQYIVFACSLANSELINKPDFPALISNIVRFWSDDTFDPIETRFFADEDWRMPQIAVNTFSLPGEDVIPLWTILGTLLLILVCVEWCLYQRRWLE